MNFFHSLFKSKLDAMRAAAPRATIHALHESNGFSIYLDEATAVRKVTQLGTFTDHAEDVLLDDPVPVLFIPLEQAVRFTEEVTAHHSVALVDVILADKVHAARYVMYVYFAKKVNAGIASGSWAGEWDYSDARRALKHEPEVLLYVTPTQKEYDQMAGRCQRMTQAEIDEEERKAAPVEEKESDEVDFWG